MQQQPTHITLPKEYLDALMEKICDLSKQLADVKNEMSLLSKEVQPIRKALQYKTKKVTKKEKDEEFLQRFRASQLF